jgi:plasmid stabilization system protein ParE
MINNQYHLRFLGLFYDDLKDIVDYISDELSNSDAARALVDDVESAISKRLTNPKAFEPFEMSNNRKYSYYRIYVKNFTVFYVVINDIMEVRRILYNHRDWQGLL